MFDRQDGDLADKIKADGKRNIYRTNYPIDYKPADQNDFFKMLES